MRHPANQKAARGACVVALLLLMSCGEEVAEQADLTPVEVSFEVRLGAAPFACGASFEGIGSTASTLSPTDMRFYIHDLRLLRADGSAALITLDQDGQWQHRNLALLDFEDGCGLGTAPINTSVRGAAPPGDYVGVAFNLGVPFELNHVNAAAAPPPLNETAMFWTWNEGFKHLRMDAATTGLGPDGYHIHVGSTGCEGDGQGNVTGCEGDNRPLISIQGFDPLEGTVVLDLAALLAETDVDKNTERTAPGCFADATDPDCDGILTRLGLKGSPQSAFKGE